MSEYLNTHVTPEIAGGNRSLPQSADSTRRRYGAAYVGVLIFCVVYFGRPEDWVPGLATVPLAKITAALAIIAFVLGFLGNRKLFVPKEMWLLIMLFVQLCIAIPFSNWKGGSFDYVIYGFSKIVLITLLLVQAVDSFARLRRILFVQTLAVAVVSAVSIAGEVKTIGSFGRIVGALGGIFENPNDLASSIALVFPLGLAFFAQTRNIAKKSLWLSVLGIMSFTLIRTYSRGGFLSMVVVLVACVVLMGNKARRAIVILLAIAVLAATLAGISSKYLVRTATIVDATKDETGSSLARQTLFWRSVEVAAKHPLFGVGPGQFAELSGNWQVAHNSYTELAAEAGILASIFFVWMLVYTYRKVLRVRREASNPDLRLFSAAMAASMAGFFVTLLFSSVEYLFFPYFLVAYGSVIAAIAAKEARSPGAHEQRAKGRETTLLEQPSCVV